MDFKEKLLQLSEKIVKDKDQAMTEEATKTAFVLPFIMALGYDVFDPCEVRPEHTCDVGTKKGEKIDYAISHNREKPILLIECKHWTENLDIHTNQLFRYFVASDVRFAILTNGIQYRFFSDSEKANIMDANPFFEVDITNINEYQIEQLRKFHKSYFNESQIFNSIPGIKYIAKVTAERAQFKNDCDQMREDMSAQAAGLQSQLEDCKRELDTRSQRISELEAEIKDMIEKASCPAQVTEDDESYELIDYLNMPVPYDWYKLPIYVKITYWNNERATWNGKPRDFVCTTEIAREFYGYDRKDLNSTIGRKVGESLRITGLFKQTTKKVKFGDYGQCRAWERIKREDKPKKKKKQNDISDLQNYISEIRNKQRTNR